MSGSRRGGDGLELGAVPRVHLLPPEVEGQRKVKAFRRSLLAGLAFAVLAVIIATGGVSLLLAGALAAQAVEQAQAVSIATQLKKYSSVTGVQTQVDAITAAQPVAVDREILWSPFMATLQATLPAGVVVTSFTAQLNPAGTTVTTNPLVGDHVATISVTARGPQSVLTDWLGQLTTVKGVVGATPGAFSISPDPAQYVVNVDLLINSDVTAHRFPAGK